MSDFISPYEHLAEGQRTRIVADVGVEDYAYVKGMRIGPVLGTTMAILWSKVCAKAKDMRIKDYKDAEQFEAFISECVIMTKEEAQACGTRGKRAK